MKDFTSTTRQPHFSLANIGETLFLYSSADGVWRSDGTEAGTVQVENRSGVFMGSEATVLNGKRYALTSNGLWSSDGGPWGTTRVKEFTSTSPEPPLLPLQQKLLFRTSSTPSQGAGVWQSDGTEAGTTQLFSAAQTSESSFIDDFVSANGLVFFHLWYAGHPYTDLWRTDGTQAGTFLLHQDVIVAHQFAAANTRLVFVVAVPAPAPSAWAGELWTSDGTVAGTVRIKSLERIPKQMVATPGGVLFFVKRDGTGMELWRSDGTAAGTVPVKDLCPSADEGDPQVLSTVGGVTFFSMGCQGEGTEPWRTDGTAAGTLRLGDIQPGARGSSPGSPVELNGKLYFWADDGKSGPELWKSDGTLTGTVQVRDVVPAKTGSDPRWMTAFGSSVAFTADDGLHGLSLWKSDGTQDSGVHLKSLTTLDPHYDPHLTSVRGTLFFVDTYAQELWKSDGTAAGTVLVRKAPEPNTWFIANQVAVGDSLFLSATGGLWKSDGTEAGTVLVKSIPQVISSMVEMNGKLFFLVGGYSDRLELWRSDGTEAGTGPVRLISESGESYRPPVRVNDKLFFLVSSEGSLHLWQSDGTEAGTFTDPRPLEVPQGVDAFAQAGGVLYLLSDRGQKLWRVDGAAPTLVKTLFRRTDPFESTSYYGQMGEIRGQLHLTTFSPEQGWMLWKSDGTAEGTVLLRHLELGPGPHERLAPFTRFVEAGRRLFFVNDGGEGREPWTLPFAPIVCPQDVLAEAEDPSGALVTLPEPQRAADVDPGLPIQSNYNPVEHFPLGRTDVVLIASDPAYPADTCEYSVEVRDTTGPELRCPRNVKVERGDAVDYPAPTVRDAVSAVATVTYSPPPGSSFPVGGTIVTITAKDADSNTSTCTFVVEVGDSSGCGCGSSSPAAAGWLLALGAMALSRRARRTEQEPTWSAESSRRRR